MKKAFCAVVRSNQFTGFLWVFGSVDRMQPPLHCMQLVPSTHPAYKPLVLTLRGRRNSHPFARPMYQSTPTCIWFMHRTGFWKRKPASLMSCEIADMSDFGWPINLSYLFKQAGHDQCSFISSSSSSSSSRKTDAGISLSLLARSLARLKLNTNGRYQGGLEALPFERMLKRGLQVEEQRNK